MSRGMSIFVNIGAKLLPSLNSSASAIERRFGQMNQRLRVQAAETKLAYKELTGAMKPVAAMAAAGGLSMGLKGAIGSGNQYAHEIAMLRAAGRTTTEVSQAIAQSNKTMREIPTSTLIDNLKIINETTGAFGNFQHALENLSFNSKFGYMMTNMLGTDPSEVPHALNSAVQALEIRGTAMDNKLYQSDMNALFKAMVFTKGRFNPEELMGFAKTGNIPLKLYGQHFLSRVLPSLITELGGGDIVGTQAAAFRNQIMGRVPLGGKKLTEEWVRLGLVPATGTGGNMSKTGWTAGTVKGHSLAMSDPFAWIETVMLPAMASKGVDITNQEQVLLQLGKMFGRETAMRFVATMADPRQRARLHKDEKMIGQALPLDQSFKLMLETDPNAAIAKTMASIKNLETRLGAAFSDNIIKALNSIAGGVNALADVIEKRPWVGKLIMVAMGLGAIGASLALFGIGLRYVFGPFRMLWKLFFLAGPRQIGLVGWLFRGLGKLAPALGRALMSLGPLALRALMAIGPFLLRGAAMAFGLLSNPVGWAIIAASIALLLWKYRKEIAAGWTRLCAWFTGTAWPAVKNTVLSINWRSVGVAIADAMTFGLASKLPTMMEKVRTAAAPGGFLSGTFMGKALTGGGPTIAGARALGGPILAGRSYLVGERGPELVTPSRSGYVHPASATRRMGANDNGGVHVGAINIYGANDPEETARAVDRRLRQLGAGQSSSLSD